MIHEMALIILIYAVSVLAQFIASLLVWWLVGKSALLRQNGFLDLIFCGKCLPNLLAYSLICAVGDVFLVLLLLNQ